MWNKDPTWKDLAMLHTKLVVSPSCATKGHTGTKLYVKQMFIKLCRLKIQAYTLMKISGEN